MVYRKALLTVSIIFVSLLLVITFFSQTLADLRVPRVTVEFTEGRVLTQQALTSGVVTPANTDTFFAPVDGVIVQLAERGQVLPRPGVLFTIYVQAYEEREGEAEEYEEIVRYVEVTAGTSRMVLEIMPGLVVGARVSAGDPVMATAVRGSRFFIEVPLSPWHDFVDIGNTATIEIGPNSFTGSVERIFAHDGDITARIEMQEDALMGGEPANVTITRNAGNFAYTLPRSAVREGNDGYYLLYLEAEPRRFGVSYYAGRMRILLVVARCAHYIAFFVMEDNINYIPIILNSDVPIYAGDRVRPVNIGDFDETR